MAVRDLFMTTDPIGTMPFSTKTWLYTRRARSDRAARSARVGGYQTCCCPFSKPHSCCTPSEAGRTSAPNTSSHHRGRGSEDLVLRRRVWKQHRRSARLGGEQRARRGERATCAQTSLPRPAATHSSSVTCRILAKDLEG
eukprot:80588-Rhodomonas_salina.1